MVTVDAALRRELRARAHHLHPVVAIGAHGLTPAVLHEIDVNLMAHELVKLRVHDGARDEREALLLRVCDALDAAPVQHVGKVLVIYRPNPLPERPRAPSRGQPQPQPQPQPRPQPRLQARPRPQPGSPRPRRRRG
jgi:putative YhbY family RNA-binding protein